MSQLQDLIAKLESISSSERNAAAIALMDLGDPLAVEPLIRAIENPANRNARGSLIYALSGFPCAGRFSQLFSWAIEGGYETSCEVLSIIEDQQLKPSVEDLEKCEQLLSRSSGIDAALLAELEEVLNEKSG